jgi:hypothetical protein
MKRYIIHSDEQGIYLGVIYGDKSVWAKPKRSNFGYAAETFETVEGAQAVIDLVTSRTAATRRLVAVRDADLAERERYRVVEVQADAAGRATVAACVAAGVPEAADELFADAPSKALH